MQLNFLVCVTVKRKRYRYESMQWIFLNGLQIISIRFIFNIVYLGNYDLYLLLKIFGYIWVFDVIKKIFVRLILVIICQLYSLLIVLIRFGILFLFLIVIIFVESIFGMSYLEVISIRFFKNNFYYSYENVLIFLLLKQQNCCFFLVVFFQQGFYYNVFFWYNDR